MAFQVVLAIVVVLLTAIPCLLLSFSLRHGLFPESFSPPLASFRVPERRVITIARSPRGSGNPLGQLKSVFAHRLPALHLCSIHPVQSDRQLG